MVEAGILASGRGRVRLLRPEELPTEWDPEKGPRLTAWEMVHHLIRALESGGEAAAFSYNGPVQGWPEIVRLGREGQRPRAAESARFGGPEEQDRSVSTISV